MVMVLAAEEVVALQAEDPHLALKLYRTMVLAAQVIVDLHRGPTELV